MKLITFYKLYYDHRLKKSQIWLKIYLILTIPIKYLINNIDNYKEWII